MFSSRVPRGTARIWRELLSVRERSPASPASFELIFSHLRQQFHFRRRIPLMRLASAFNDGVFHVGKNDKSFLGIFRKDVETDPNLQIRLTLSVLGYVGGGTLLRREWQREPCQAISDRQTNISPADSVCSRRLRRRHRRRRSVHRTGVAFLPEARSATALRARLA